jgi:hypothetical protein
MNYGAYFDKQKLTFYIIPTIAYLPFYPGWAIQFEWGWWSFVINDRLFRKREIK